MKRAPYLPMGLQPVTPSRRMSRFQVWFLGFIAGKTVMLAMVIVLEKMLP